MDIINDNFADAIVLNGNSISTTGSNLAATGEFGELVHAGVNFDPSFDTNFVWWAWTALTSGSITIDTFGSDFDTSLAVYIGSELSQLIEVANNDDRSGFQSEVSFSAIAGENYQIAVDGYGSSQGSIALNLDLETILPTHPSLVPGAMADFGFESADFSGVATLGNTAVEGDSLGISPTEGDFQSSLSTLDSEVADDAIASFLGLAPGSLDVLGNGDATVGSAIRLTTIEIEACEVLSFN